MYGGSQKLAWTFDLNPLLLLPGLAMKRNVKRMNHLRARMSSIALVNTCVRQRGTSPEGEPKRLSSSRQAEKAFPEPRRRTTRLASVKKLQSEDYGAQSAKKASFCEDPGDNGVGV